MRLHLAVMLPDGRVRVTFPPRPHDQQPLPAVAPFLDLRTDPPIHPRRPPHCRRKVQQLEFRSFVGRWPWKSKTRPMRPLTRKEKPFLTRKEIAALGDKGRKERKILRHWMREADKARPLKREECVNGPRPCQFISCMHHLYVDVSTKSGSLKVNFPPSPPITSKSEFMALPTPRIEVHRALRLMRDTCALDVADRGGVTLEEIGVLLNVSMERARQILESALDKLRLEVDDDYSLKDSEARQRAIKELIAERLSRSTDEAADHDDEEGDDETGW